MIRISHRLVSMSGRHSFFYKTNPLIYHRLQQPSMRTVTPIRSFHCSAMLFDEKSKLEKTVDLLKDKTEGEQIKPSATAATGSATTSPTAGMGTVTTGKPLTPVASTTDTVATKRKTLWERIVHELKHYYNGFKLLFIETKIAFRLLRQVLSGHTLTRRERKQVFSILIDNDHNFSISMLSNL